MHRINSEISDIGLHDGVHVPAAAEALRPWRSWCARRDAGLRDARLAEAVAAGDVDVQMLQGQALHADAAGEGLGAVGLGRGLLAVPGGLPLELLGDELELCVLRARLGAAKVLDLLLEMPDLVDVSDPLRTLGLTHRGAHLGHRVGHRGLALVASLGHACCLFACLVRVKEQQKNEGKKEMEKKEERRDTIRVSRVWFVDFFDWTWYANK